MLWLVQDTWRFGLRESPAGEPPGGRVPGTWEPGSQPASRLSLSQPVLCLPPGQNGPLCCGLGALLAWRPGVIVPKPSFPVPSLGLWKSGTEKGQSLGAD